jgi:hypothetical protein
MANDKPKKEPKRSKQILLPFIIGMSILAASWYYWPVCEAFFILRYFKAFQSSISPVFILALYLIILLLVIFIIARLLKRFSVFMGFFLPLVIFIGMNEWKTYEAIHKYIDFMGVINLLFDLFTKRSW